MIPDHAALAALEPGVRVLGVVPGTLVVVVAVQPIGQAAVKITYGYGDGLTVEKPGDWRPRFNGDGAPFRLASEALRIRMAGQFDPMLAVHTSELEPLPHQIQAVVAVDPDRDPEHDQVRYLANPFVRTEFGDFEATGVAGKWAEVWDKGEPPW